MYAIAPLKASNCLVPRSQSLHFGIRRDSSRFTTMVQTVQTGIGGIGFHHLYQVGR